MAAGTVARKWRKGDSKAKAVVMFLVPADGPTTATDAASAKEAWQAPKVLYDGETVIHFSYTLLPPPKFCTTFRVQFTTPNVSVAALVCEKGPRLHRARSLLFGSLIGSDAGVLHRTLAAILMSNPLSFLARSRRHTPKACLPA